MKHSLRSYDEKMENESLSVCNTTLSALYYDLQSSLLWLDFFYILISPNEWQVLIANLRPNGEQIENAKFSLNRCVLNKLAANSLFIKVGGLLCSFIL